MKVSEYLAMKPEELAAKIAELKTELFNLRFQLATGQLENTMQIQVVKRASPRKVARWRSTRRKVSCARSSPTLGMVVIRAHSVRTGS